MKSLYLQCLYRFSEVLHPPDGCKLNETDQASSQAHTFIRQTEKTLYNAVTSYVFIGLTLMKRGGQNNVVTLWIPCWYNNCMSYLPANTVFSAEDPQFSGNLKTPYLLQENSPILFGNSASDKKLY